MGIGQPQRVAFGGVLRNPQGEWLRGYSGYLGDEDILLAELTGIWISLSIYYVGDGHHQPLL